MKAIEYSEYGPLAVLQINDIDTPTPRNNEIRVKIHATTVTPVDCSFRSGDPCITRFYTGLLRPKSRILGTELAGEIDTVGRDVTRFKVGDRVFAAPADGLGAHAQFICLPEDGAQTTMPANMAYDEAATICNGALTALPFLRDSAKIRRGQRVLINGASGSIGTFAVQIAKHFGAKVTGVCSGANLDLVKSLSADDVFNYQEEDFTRSGQTWDIIFDTVGKSSFSRCKGVLAKRGYYLSTVPTFETARQMLWTSMAGGKKAILSATGLRPARDQIEDMEYIKDLIETGRLKTVIDRSYPLNEIAEAHRYVELGHKRGNVVVTMDHD